MEIRQVDLEQDLVPVLAGMHDFIERMEFHDFLPEEDEELILALDRLIELGAEVLVAEDNGWLVGGIGIFYAPCIWNSKLLIGEELFWWSHEKAPKTTALRLIRAALDSASKRGCKIFNFKSLPTSPPAIDKVYRRLGMKPVETVYMGAC